MSTSYDDLPYPSYPYAHSHPRNLAALATLFGMSPPLLSHCRVLEIGCAAGGNLLPMAIDFPHSHFYGIDASLKQIEAGQQVIDDLHISNITLQKCDILDFDQQDVEFDFIICHGVYSWVPAEVQQKILEVCRANLAAKGVAYVSYNTYPGWFLRRNVREMMSYHAAGFDDSKSKIDQSRALLNFLIEAVASDGGAYEMMLREELQLLRGCNDSYLFHEHLEAVNEPLFFHEFVERANQAKLRFLCEANFSSMLAHGFSKEIRETLTEIAPDIIQMEQYLDFLRNRKFRQTLLVHQKTDLKRGIEPTRVHNLFVSSPMVPVDTDDGRPNEDMQTFSHPNGKSVTVTSPIQKSALKQLAEIWPSELSVELLANNTWQGLLANQRPNREECLFEVAAMILECFSSQLVELFASKSNAVSNVGNLPQASAYNRYLLDHGELVTNARHETVKLSNFDRAILQQLDGKVTVAELTEEMQRWSVKTEVSQPDTSKPQEISQAVEHSLVQMAKSALLIS